MICPACRAAADDYDLSDTPSYQREGRMLHRSCKGRTHCDCQHKVRHPAVAPHSDVPHAVVTPDGRVHRPADVIIVYQDGDQ